MRRKDRAITDFDAIVKIMEECDIIRLGLLDGEFPYIVPVNFAYRTEGEQIEFYVHGAMAGRKYELMKRNRSCSFEMDVPVKMECMYETGDITMRYKSVMGTARIEFLEGEEKQQAMEKVLLARYEETKAFPYNKKVMARTAVAKLTVIELTAKANLG